jgi:hypothetical protein
LKDFDKVIELLARYKWYIWLLNTTKGKMGDSSPNPLPEKRTLADIALQYIWEGKIINNQNKNKIASLFPELNLKNGDKLYQKFNFYSKQTNRINDQDDDNKNIRHLENMLRAYKYLKNPDHIKAADKEIDMFKKRAKEMSGQIM